MDVYFNALGHVRVAKVGVSGKGRRVENGDDSWRLELKETIPTGKSDWEGILLGFKASPNHRVFLFESFGVIFFL